MKKRIITSITIFLIISTLTFLGFYLFSNKFYIAITYGKNIQVEENKIKVDLNKLQISDQINNYIRTTRDYGFITISKSGYGTAKIFKNGRANLSFYIDENGKAIVEFMNIIDSNDISYLEEIPNKRIEINIKKDKAKYITYHKDYLYILTEEGNLYISRINSQNDTVNFEHEISNITNGLFWTSLTNKNIKEIIEYYNNNETFTNARIYALLSDNNIINVFTKKDLKEEEKHASIFRFGNARLVVNRDASIQYCNGYDDIENPCSGKYLGKVITDSNGKVVKISQVIIHDSKLYIIDIENNIYIEKFDNQNHTVIEKINKYKNKKIKNLTYINKKEEPYMLEELIINYTDGTRTQLKELSRINIHALD